MSKHAAENVECSVSQYRRVCECVRRRVEWCAAKGDDRGVRREIKNLPDQKCPTIASRVIEKFRATGND